MTIDLFAPGRPSVTDILKFCMAIERDYGPDSHVTKVAEALAAAVMDARHEGDSTTEREQNLLSACYEVFRHKDGDVKSAAGWEAAQADLETALYRFGCERSANNVSAA